MAKKEDLVKTEPKLTDLPAAWADAEELDGVEIVEKQTLVGVPHRITSVRFYEGANEIEYVEVEAELTDGSAVTYNDSSKGIRAQLINLLTNKGLDAAVDTGNAVPLDLLIRKGLRVSTYHVTDDRGRKKESRTYYLTTKRSNGS